jgi:hypothetical protein
MRMPSAAGWAGDLKCDRLEGGFLVVSINPDNALLRLAGRGPGGADVFVRLVVGAADGPTRPARQWIPVRSVLIVVAAPAIG